MQRFTSTFCRLDCTRAPENNLDFRRIIVHIRVSTSAMFPPCALNTFLRVIPIGVYACSNFLTSWASNIDGSYLKSHGLMAEFFIDVSASGNRDCFSVFILVFTSRLLPYWAWNCFIFLRAVCEIYFLSDKFVLPTFAVHSYDLRAPLDSRTRTRMCRHWINVVDAENVLGQNIPDFFFNVEPLMYLPIYIFNIHFSKGYLSD